MKVEVGQELPELVKHPTTRQLVQYAGAQGDFYEIHYDQAYAQSVALPGVILHGLLKAAFLGQLITDWLGEDGTLKAFEVSYRGVDMPGHPYRCRGPSPGSKAGMSSWRSGARTRMASGRRSAARSWR